MTLAANVQKAAAKVSAAGAVSSRSFYASSDGWVCFGNPARANVVLPPRAQGMVSRLYPSATAAADATALNAVMATAVAAQRAVAQIAAQAAYTTAANALSTALKAKAG